MVSSAWSAVKNTFETAWNAISKVVSTAWETIKNVVKENIWTLDAKGELLITIMSSLAQEESRSISENTTWGWRRRFADGKASVGYSHFLGYDKDFKVNEEQAKTVRRIYKEYLSGLSCHAIAKGLEADGIPAPAGGKRWHADSVQSILSNEKYMGDALLQKFYTTDFLTKKMEKNNGEVPQYYVENHHEGIIDEATFKLVQAEMQKRNADPRSYSGVSIFSSKIVCGECGCYFGSKVWHSNDKYRKVIWQCNHKYRKGYKEKCKTPHLSEDEIKEIFVKAMDLLKGDREEILANAKLLQESAADTSGLENELELTAVELTALVERTQDAIDENARKAQDQQEYEARYNELVSRYEEKKARYDELAVRIDDAKANAEILAGFIRQLEEIGSGAIEFSEDDRGGLVDHMTVFSKDKIEVTLKSGTSVTVG